MKPECVIRVLSLTIVASLLIVGNSVEPEAGVIEKQNVLLVVVDDLRPEFNVSYGQNFLHTPNLDAFSKDSTSNKSSRALVHIVLMLSSSSIIQTLFIFITLNRQNNCKNSFTFFASTLN